MTKKWTYAELLWLLSLRRACEVSRVLADGLARFAGRRA